jgi:hypothetical protein
MRPGLTPAGSGADSQAISRLAASRGLRSSCRLSVRRESAEYHARRNRCCSLFCLFLRPLSSVASDTLFAVEVYGLRSVPEAAIRSAIGTRAGDPVPQDHEAIRSRVRAVPGVAQVDVSVVCCSNFGTPIMYVGVRESMVPPITYRASPSGDIRLPPDLLAVGARFASAMEEAVRRGSGAEDHSRGYALSEDSAVRSIQLEFIDIAARDFDLLSNVLEHSADPTHRAIAAHILVNRPGIAGDSSS